MAASAGRKLRIKYDADGAGGAAAVPIAGAKTDDFSIAVEGIDITDKDDAGVRTYLNDVGSVSIDANIEGVMSDTTLMSLAASAGENSALHYFEIEVAALGTFSGEWLISQFSSSGAEGTDPTTFTCSIQSSGPITFT